ncbi:hypothetical protein F5B22DRAFT_626436 [Xylaria bambusicola]|uniref:uncharacterized protein n=1 Tax=Xylaria bambusicola TaxID=326684 RepID=UPI002007AECE|nr:uncharacterized protein F5B22DRAFT_626436 [Xylaria bambusicola]KAI0505816.1 hypothetical protein F5B22DRAFT_626436 [Xylaria bambusicola]
MASVASPQEVGTQEVIDFFQLLGTLATNASATCVEKALKENKELKGDKDSLVRALTNLQIKLDDQVKRSEDAVAQSEDAKAKASALTSEVEGAKQTIADKDKKSEYDASTISGLQGKVAALDDEVKAREEQIKKHMEQQVKDANRISDLDAELGMKKTELEITSNQLKELQDLSCKVIDESKDFVLSELDKIYGYAKVIAFKYFTGDLSDEVLAETAFFEGIGREVKLPLHPSNSIPAKKVRIAVFLASLGTRLADEIFVPFYFLPNEDQNLPEGIDTITMMLSNLSQVDPKRELHLRSVLLAIYPDEQTKVANNRAIEIAGDIYHVLRFLVIEDQRENFHKEIMQLCRLAVESWNTLRPLKEKVEPFTATEDDTEKYWLPAEFDSTSQTKKLLANAKPNGLGSKPSLNSLKSAKGIKLVWPGFSYGNEVLKQGFMLLDSQVAGASEEAPLKRNVRAMQRASTGSPVLSQRRSVTKKSKFLLTAGE